ncbi:MAG: hypothetical protein J6R88_00290 [Clostridia bacterium]|nr:hypothetical protein [Clostridia bacterium]
MKVFNLVINFITNLCLGSYLPYIILGLTLTVFITLIITFIVSVSVKKPLRYTAIKYLLSALILINIALCFLEYFFKKEVFSISASLIIYSVLLVSITLIFTSILSVVKSAKLKVKKSTKNEINVPVHSENVVEINGANNREVIKIKCVNPTAYGGEFDGFLDISYLKSLLSQLNEKNLTEEDRKDLEDFEVYLMNFASRQPYRSERVKLSAYLSDFIKKLARYNVC